MKKIKTARFGELEIEEDKIFYFVDGLPAFEEEHRFVILPFEDDSPYAFLQSVTTPDLAFLVTVPFVFFPNYEFELDDAVTERLALKTSEDMQIYALLTIPNGSIKDITAKQRDRKSVV